MKSKVVRLSSDWSNRQRHAAAEEVANTCEEAMEMLSEGLEEVFIPYDGSPEMRELYKHYAREIEANVTFSGLGFKKWRYVVWFSVPRS